MHTLQSFLQNTLYKTQYQIGPVIQIAETSFHSCFVARPRHIQYRNLSACLLTDWWTARKCLGKATKPPASFWNLIVMRDSTTRCDIAGQQTALDGRVKKHRTGHRSKLLISCRRCQSPLARWRNQRNATRVHVGIDDCPPPPALVKSRARRDSIRDLSVQCKSTWRRRHGAI